MNAPFGRVLTAMVTPFTADGAAVDLDAAARLAVHLVDQGNDGLVLSGTTGEAPTTTDEEKDALLRTVVEAIGDRAKVVAGVGTNDTSHTVELAKHAEKCGAAGVLVVTPYYSKPSQPGLVQHFRAVADGTGLPVMLYDIPGRSCVPISTDSLLRLAEHPHIVAVKDAKGDLYGTSTVLAETDLAYYSGEDALNLPLLAIGAVGVVSVVSHVCAPRYVQMVDAVAAGDLDTARAMNTAVLPAVRGIMTRIQGAAAAKAALEMVGVTSNRATRLPLVPATDDEVDVLHADLVAAGVLS
jgi:4-hydroxy-tetrahydrodipicolinate synthase